jgi:hypothetical protein
MPVRTSSTPSPRPAPVNNNGNNGLTTQQQQQISAAAAQVIRFAQTSGGPSPSNNTTSFAVSPSVSPSAGRMHISLPAKKK